MEKKGNKKLELTCNMMSHVLVLATAAIGASVAFLQIHDLSSSTITSVKFSIAFFILTLVVGVVGLAALINQADEETPDFNAGGVRLPNFLSMFFFGAGIIAFLWGTWGSPGVQAAPSSKSPPNDFREHQISVQLSEKIKGLNEEQQLLLKNFIDKAFP